MIGVVIGFFALAHSIYKTRVRGPQIDIVDARVIEREKDKFRVMVLVQNTGDRMGFTRWDIVKIQIREHVFVSNHPPTWEWDTQADKQTRVAFTFFIGDIDLTGGFFLAEGECSFKGEMVPKIYKYSLKGQLKPIHSELD